LRIAHCGAPAQYQAAQFWFSLSTPPRSHVFVVISLCEVARHGVGPFAGSLKHFEKQCPEAGPFSPVSKKDLILFLGAVPKK
jgi:hypothetical protein